MKEKLTFRKAFIKTLTVELVIVSAMLVYVILGHFSGLASTGFALVALAAGIARLITL